MSKHVPFHCQDIRICAAALLDGQLSPAEEQLMEEHLFECDACAEFLGQLEEQKIQPPRLQIIQDDEYWSQMDAVLQAELDKAERKSPKPSIKWFIAYAVVLILSLIWGNYEHQRVKQLEYVVQTQQRTLENLAQQVQQAQQNPSKSVVYVPAKMEL